MIIRYFQPGMITEIRFLMPGAGNPQPRHRLCVVMSVHVKGLLVHPLAPRGTSVERHAVYTRKGRIACDLRNIIEAPMSHAIAHAMKDGMPDFAKARLTDEEFNRVRERSLDCAYSGVMKCERLRSDPMPLSRKRQA